MNSISLFVKNLLQSCQQLSLIRTGRPRRKPTPVAIQLKFPGW
ncbi:hypothetical protein [Luteolibacter pohnpeiensis]|nr:hypothetical protein [Luteolibacter pohnpeiensis]